MQEALKLKHASLLLFSLLGFGIQGQAQVNLQLGAARYGNFFSEEQIYDGAIVNSQGATFNLPSSIRAKGDFSDDLQLSYKTTTVGSALGFADSFELMPVFSDNGESNCPANKVIARISCYDRYCDNLQLTCAFVKYANARTATTSGIYYTNVISDSGGNIGGEAVCNYPFVAVGLTCSGSFCDNMALKCGRLSSPDCNPGFFGTNCVACPACVNGVCLDGVNGAGTCSCATGWTGPLCNVDINECSTTTHGCQQNCVNTIGSYFCTCNAGFTLINGRTCQGPVTLVPTLPPMSTGVSLTITWNSLVYTAGALTVAVPTSSYKGVTVEVALQSSPNRIATITFSGITTQGTILASQLSDRGVSYTPGETYIWRVTPIVTPLDTNVNSILASPWYNATATCGCRFAGSDVPASILNDRGWWDPPAQRLSFGGVPAGIEVRQVFDTVYGRITHGSICQDSFYVDRDQVQIGEPWTIRARAADCLKTTEWRKLESLTVGVDLPLLNKAYSYGARSSDGLDFLSDRRSISFSVAWAAKIRIRATTKAKSIVYDTVFTITSRSFPGLSWTVTSSRDAIDGDGYATLLIQSATFNSEPVQPFNIVASKVAAYGSHNYTVDNIEASGIGANFTFSHLSTKLVEFTDVSSRSVKGNVYYANAGNLPGASALCGAVGVQVCVYAMDRAGAVDDDPLTCVPITTSNGAFEVPVPIGVPIRLIPIYNTIPQNRTSLHTFSPASTDFASGVTDNQVGVLFTDTTLVPLDLKTYGGLCETDIGKSTIKLWTDSCGSFTPITVSVQNKFQRLFVSPINWWTEIQKFDSFSDTTIGGSSNFFRNLEQQSRNMSDLIPKSIIYRYHAQPTLLVDIPAKFAYPSCAANGIDFVVTQNRNFNVSIRVVENYINNNGETVGTCTRVNTSIYVRDEISQGPCTESSCKLSYLPSTTTIAFTISPGQPVIESPYSKALTVLADRTDALFSVQTRVEKKVVIEGSKVIGDSFTQNLPRAALPLLVLRRPPGDQSYASISVGTRIKAEFEQEDKGGSTGGFLMENEKGFEAGGQLTCIGIGAVVCEQLPEFQFTAKMNVETESQDTSANVKKHTLEFLVTEQIVTPITPDATPDANDIILAPSMMVIFAMARYVRFNSGTCAVTVQSGFTWKPSPASPSLTEALYTIGYLENIELPRLRDQYGAAIRGDLSLADANYTAAALLQDITTWQNFLDRHRSVAATGGTDGGTNPLNQYANNTAVLNAIKSSKIAGLISVPLTGVNTNIASASTSSLDDTLTGAFSEDSIISFSGGISYTKSFEYHAVAERKFVVEMEDKSKGGLGLETEILGPIDAKFDLSFSSGSISAGKTESGVEEERNVVISYTLSDDDSDNVISTLIRRDPIYGTPIFTTLGGQTSCPYEPGTSALYTIEARTDDPDRTRYPIAPGSSHHFVFEVTSDSIVDTTWVLKPRAETVRGLKISLNGNPFTSVEFLIHPGGSANFYVSIERGDADLAVLEDVTFDLIPSCMDQNNPDDAVASLKVSVAFLEDCARANWAGDMETRRLTLTPWIANLANGIIPISFYNPEFATSPWETDPRLRSVFVQYKEVTSDTWKTLGDYRESEDFYGYVSVSWNSMESPLLDDNEYYLRLYTVCAASSVASMDTYESAWISLIKDTTIPFSFGVPEPADEDYTPGDEISVSYNEPLLCPQEKQLKPVVTAKKSDGTLLDFVSLCEDRKIELYFGPLTDISTLAGEIIQLKVNKALDRAQNSAAESSWSFAINSLIDVNTLSVRLHTLKLTDVALATAQDSSALVAYIQNQMTVNFGIPSSRMRIEQVSYVVTVAGSKADVTFDFVVLRSSGVSRRGISLHEKDAPSLVLQVALHAAAFNKTAPSGSLPLQLIQGISRTEYVMEHRYDVEKIQYHSDIQESQRQHRPVLVPNMNGESSSYVWIVLIQGLTIVGLAVTLAVFHVRRQAVIQV